MLKKTSFKLILPFLAATIILSPLLIHSSAETIETSLSSTIKSNTELQYYIDKYKPLVMNITDELRNNGYSVVVDYSLSSDEKIELLIKTSEKNTKKTLEAISQIIENTINENKFTPSSFSMTITNYYEPAENTNTSSIRLSYNDLIGYIGEELFAKYDVALSLHYEVSSKKTKLALSLPVNFYINNEEIQDVMLDLIKQHKFSPHIFQIEITHNINIMH
ncbi:hypothetical protein [Lysinibacillus odysseyi]|uniref:Uncharacterized protein n=1 Tax=Lysinibacillus odysseyi 34hs-1 = NBRC 100172 TaxID=1220589 RepID=A0A0A3IAC6_9BACI|nr:hypothetical protein [Lysinibacillus odysseyi]KGR81689.1 hypothetical protein CD32_20300 [Lysinibacillus odysseyi 34hs-1 = NBRC 100172]